MRATSSALCRLCSAICRFRLSCSAPAWPICSPKKAPTKVPVTLSAKEANIDAAAKGGYRMRLNSSGRSDLPELLWILGLRQTRCHRNNSAVAFACYRMRRGLAQLLPEGHQSIEKRSCKQPDSNARPKHQNVSFSAHCRSVWGLLSLVLLTTGNVGPSSPTKCSAS
jgi:hypothetical protein